MACGASRQKSPPSSRAHVSVSGADCFHCTTSAYFDVCRSRTSGNSVWIRITDTPMRRWWRRSRGRHTSRLCSLGAWSDREMCLCQLLIIGVRHWRIVVIKRVCLETVREMRQVIECCEWYGDLNALTSSTFAWIRNGNASSSYISSSAPGSSSLLDASNGLSHNRWQIILEQIIIVRLIGG